ncbi:MAG: glutamine--fructose-6-phosphate transaminase (isomerizing) [Thaumarchaeota archaeon]|nr:glutamine--fructose-6-phosphate transaminase (isomerizing) [Nitrososphaerota archaeon]
MGYVGGREASSILLDGLRRLEYRGYDSAGIGTIDSKHKLNVVKDVGKVEQLAQKTELGGLRGIAGIAHTRWATHGGVTSENAHPHLSCKQEVAIVHNGIIENYLELRQELEGRGHRFISETDSEVIAHLIEEVYERKKDLLSTLIDVVQRLKGAYAFAAILVDAPNVMVGARQDAPLVVGLGKSENFLASDALAFIGNTDRVVFLDNRELVLLTEKNVKIYDFAGNLIQKPATQIAWELGSVSRREFEHYTLKEIHEQKDAVLQALRQDPRSVDYFVDAVQGAGKVYLTGCGTSFHAALLAKLLFTSYAKIPVEVLLSSEFEQYEGMLDEKSLLIAVSQSGETADVLSAVKAAKKMGARVLSIVNAMGSTLVRESACTLLNNCGPEIGVAATKSFTAQLMIFNMLALRLGHRDDELSELWSTGSLVEKALGLEDQVREMTERIHVANDFYFVGRSIHHPLALEGALKLKELSYIHAEGMAAGELKHGSLALISEGVPVVVLNPEDATYADTLSNASEVKARGGRIIGVSNKPSKVYDEYIEIPAAPPVLYPVLEAVPLQMMAYYAAISRQQNPDYPRNLAKSVTVK